MPTPFTTCGADAKAIDRLRKAELDVNPAVPVEHFLQKYLSETEYWFKGLKTPWSLGNSVIAYIYGVCAFADIGAALATATDATHRIYMLGWNGVLATQLNSGKGGLLEDYLSRTKAEIRGMYWDGPKIGNIPDNQWIVKFINGLPNGAAILDHKLPFLRIPPGQQTGIRGAVHHQKLLVVSGSSGLIAFAGGMDIDPNRVDVRPAQGQPWHDVQLRVIGDGAQSLLKVFEQRWLDHPDSDQLDRSKFKKGHAEVSRDFAIAARSGAKPDLATSSRSGGLKNDTNHMVTIGRTYANLPKFTGNREEYSFAPRGEESGWSIVQNAIQKAKKFVYIEDQYFVSRRVKTELLKKLVDPNFTFLLILMQNSNALDEFPNLIAARNEIRTDFLSVDPKQKKWRMFTLTTSPDPDRQKFCGHYVHSKTMIMDDDFAVVGSANVDDRGYTWDTEIVMGVTDDPTGRAARQHFAKNLRINLWHKHLGVNQDWLFKWESALKYWQTPPSQAMIVDGSSLEDSPLLGPKPILRSIKAIDEQWGLTNDPDADKLP